jgi:hypothetical protein
MKFNADNAVNGELVIGSGNGPAEAFVSPNLNG